MELSRQLEGPVYVTSQHLKSSCDVPWTAAGMSWVKQAELPVSPLPGCSSRVLFPAVPSQAAAVSSLEASRVPVGPL